MTLANNGKEKKSFLSGIMDKFGSKKKEENSNPSNKNIQLNTKQEKEEAMTKESMTQSVMNSFMSSTNNYGNGISNTISSSITPDLLSNIDLNKSNTANKKEENHTTNTNGASTASASNSAKSSVNYNPSSKIKNPLSRLSMPSSRLASESIDYEPVFK